LTPDEDPNWVHSTYIQIGRRSRVSEIITAIRKLALPSDFAEYAWTSLHNAWRLPNSFDFKPHFREPWLKKARQFYADDEVLAKFLVMVSSNRFELSLERIQHFFMSYCLHLALAIETSKLKAPK
jgi:hypothetical protein